MVYQINHKHLNLLYWCLPILKLKSGLCTFSGSLSEKTFGLGYSPERINPGDKQHTISNTKKITSGSTPRIAELVDNLYKDIVKAGTHKASSIRIAEAAKVIENIQRDVNIALINEFTMIFEKYEAVPSNISEEIQAKFA